MPNHVSAPTLDVATVVSSRLVMLPQRMEVVSPFVGTFRLFVHRIHGHQLTDPQLSPDSSVSSGSRPPKPSP